MKLDKRIIEGKKPLTGFDIAEVQDFIGEDGFFSDTITGFVNLKLTRQGTLLGIAANENYPFPTGDNTYRYFLPKKWVREKEPEPVWKPYDLDSWRNDNFKIGSVITFRIKPKNNPDSKNTIVKSLIYLGDEEHSGDSNDIYIYIGTLGYSFQYLFESYEIFDDKYEKPGCPKWRPFGCLE